MQTNKEKTIIAVGGQVQPLVIEEDFIDLD